MPQYGFFFDWSYRDVVEGQQGHDVLRYWHNQELLSRATADLALIAQMHANTVRLYTDLGDDPVAARRLLDEAYQRGIMVILTVAVSKADLDAGRHLTVVERYKDHPAILMWSLGNEWNFSKYFGYTMPQAITATETAAQAIKPRDAHHPVSSSLGDRFSDAQTCNPATDPCCAPVDPDSDIPAIVAAVPSVDLWGLNIYRGASFGTLFAQWSAVTSKPMYLSEFGTDSFATQGYTPVACGLADNVVGLEDQAGQASHDTGLWQEIQGQLSALKPSAPSAGGLVHEFNDELWKVGSFHVGLGNLVDYDGPDNIPGTADDDTSYDEYNPEGYVVLGSHPDGVANEERFGIVTADRSPKQAFGALQALFTELSRPVLEPIGAKSVNEGQSLSFSVVATDPDGDPITYSASPLPAGATLNALTGAFAWTPGYAPAGSYNVTFTASDGALTDAEPVTMTVNDVPLPGLILTAVTPGASTANAGTTLSVTTTVLNQGAAAAGSFTVAFRLSKNRVYGDADDLASASVRSVSSLAINTSSTAATPILISSTTPAGTYYVCAMVDSGSAVVESVETNNTLYTATTITVTRPDMVMSAVSGPATGTRGSAIIIATTVTNQGVVSSGGSMYTGLYLSADPAITTTDARIGVVSVVTVNAASSASYTTSVTLSTTLAPGTYYLGAIADYTNKVIELDESNNSRSGNTIVIQ